MPRPQVHDTDSMLDAARNLLLAEGALGVTVEAISAASGAPTGSIYHRFGSRDELVARLWMRAVYRSQASFLVALEDDDPYRAAVGAAISIIEFCEQHPADAQLLVAFRREDLVRAVPTADLVEELAELNRPVERAVVALARRLYGRRTRAALERTLLCVFDLPYGAARRHLSQGERLPRGLKADLEIAIEAVLRRPL
jgi:AcrR family transcriptional regulator